MIGEIVAEGILQVAAYGLGRTLAAFFLPHLGIEPLEKQKSIPRCKWRGFTYEKSGRRFLYTESIQLLGWAVLLFVGIGFAIMIHNAI